MSVANCRQHARTSRGSRQVLQRLYELGDKVARLYLVWVDGGYKGAPFLEWVMERTFSWLGHFHRLSKDYEYLPSQREAMIYAAMVHVMLKRLAPSTANA